MKKIAKFVSNFSWFLIILFLIITFLLGYFTRYIKVQAELVTGLPDNLPEVIAYNKVKEIFPSSDVIFVILESDSIFSVKYLQKIYDLTEEFLFLSGIKDVLSLASASKIKGEKEGISIIPLMEERPKNEKDVERIKNLVSGDEFFEQMLIGKDKKSTGILLILEKDLKEEEIINLYKNINKIVKKYENPEKIYISGKRITEALIAEHIIKDLRKLFPISIIVSMILLLLFFGSIRGMILPVLTVFLSSTWMMGIQGLLKIPIGMESSLLPMLLVAIGTAYGIHLIHQFNEEIKKIGDKKEAVYNTIIKRGNAVLIAGLTTVAGFYSLITQNIKTIKTFGILNGSGVLVTLLLSIILIPSFLNVLKVKKENKREIGFFNKFLENSGILIAKYYYVFLSIAILFIIFGFLGIPRIKTSSDEIENFDKRSEIRIATEYINKNYFGITPLTILFETDKEDGFKNPDLLLKIDSIINFAEKIPYVGKSMAISSFIKRLYKALNQDNPEFYKIPEDKNLISQLIFLYSMSGDPSDFESMVTSDFKKANVTIFLKTSNTEILKEVVKKIEDYSKRIIGKENIKMSITGNARLFVVMDNLIVKGQIFSLISAFILVFLITSIILHSLRAGLLSLIPMFVTVITNFGIMGFFNFALTHSTSIVASIAIGIGIDYAVHYINRMRIYGKEIKEEKELIKKTTKGVGDAIIFNLLTVAFGFMVLLLSSFKGVKEISILISITMFLSGFGAIYILPSFFMFIKKLRGG
jgi:predicted RND superfamily exporter protein